MLQKMLSYDHTGKTWRAAVNGGIESQWGRGLALRPSTLGLARGCVRRETQSFDVKSKRGAPPPHLVVVWLF